MTTSTDYCYLSITELSELIRDQKVSPVELVNECLERIEQLNPTLNAFITVLADEAKEAAAQAEQDIKNGQWEGPLHGIPVAVKDMFDTAGIRTTAAFEYFANRVPTKDAVMVTKLKEAGAIIVGKTNLHELAAGTTCVVSYFGSVHNSWNPDYMAGGSSGGSAAVAAGLCYATVDTDAIGSCRLPAACCGVVGFKATYGLLDGTGILDGEEVDDFILKMSHVAMTCRSVEDVAILLNALATPDTSAGDYTGDYRAVFGQNQPRIGVVQNFQATDEVRTVFENAVEGIRTSGLATSAVEAPLFPAFNMPDIEQQRAEISTSLLTDADVLILPTTTEAVLTIEEAKSREASKAENDVAFSPANTIFANYYGLPAVTIPYGVSENGLPLGLQIVGPRWGEALVLDTARTIQQALSQQLQHPTL